MCSKSRDRNAGFEYPEKISAPLPQRLQPGKAPVTEASSLSYESSSAPTGLAQWLEAMDRIGCGTIEALMLHSLKYLIYRGVYLSAASYMAIF